MNITTEELFTLLGAKEATIFYLTRRIAELEAQLKPVDTAPVSPARLASEISGS